MIPVLFLRRFFKFSPLDLLQGALYNREKNHSSHFCFFGPHGFGTGENIYNQPPLTRRAAACPCPVRGATAFFIDRHGAAQQRSPANQLRLRGLTTGRARRIMQLKAAAY